MNTQQIIADLELVRDILTLDASPARKAAAAVLLRAAADAIEAQGKDKLGGNLRPLEKGEAIWASDIYQQAHGKLANAETDSVGRQYDPAHYLPHFRHI